MGQGRAMGLHELCIILFSVNTLMSHLYSIQSLGNIMIIALFTERSKQCIFSYVSVECSGVLQNQLYRSNAPYLACKNEPELCHT